MKHSKIVFLDIDGVLNSSAYLHKLVEQNVSIGDTLTSKLGIDPVPVERLNRLLDETGAVVVVSSTWRKFLKQVELRGMLKSRGFTGKIVGITPDLSYEPGPKERGHEIEKWLGSRISSTKFVIFDDDSDMGNLHHRFVQTSWETGLLDEHVERAKLLLLGDG